MATNPYDSVYSKLTSELSARMSASPYDPWVFASHLARASRAHASFNPTLTTSTSTSTITSQSTFSPTPTAFRQTGIIPPGYEWFDSPLWWPLLLLKLLLWPLITRILVFLITYGFWIGVPLWGVYSLFMTFWPNSQRAVYNSLFLRAWRALPEWQAVMFHLRYNFVLDRLWYEYYHLWNLARRHMVRAFFIGLALWFFSKEFFRKDRLDLTGKGFWVPGYMVERKLDGSNFLGTDDNFLGDSAKKPRKKAVVEEDSSDVVWTTGSDNFKDGDDLFDWGRFHFVQEVNTFDVPGEADTSPTTTITTESSDAAPADEIPMFYTRGWGGHVQNGPCGEDGRAWCTLCRQRHSCGL